ncbi:cardiolipin synthase [Peptoniphilus harei]|uniref:cardiolipin synthase n=1 Tax=Peptoniphilus TaxID=162289 RepID=UPI00254BB20C|nr:cardiolipin synthase [Peptoniphilus harei]MDK7376788.1 cardiolipin synthase [Peptoniphilus harei]MDK7678744.1 cardiolipin synthase [Peptoniphilus harei]
MFSAYFGMLKNFAQVYSVLFIVNLLVSTFIILFDNKKPISTLLWVMAINFLPLLGFVLYLFIGQDISKSKIFSGKHKKDEILSKESKAQLREIKNKEFRFSKKRTAKHIDMVEMFNKAENEMLYTDNKVKIFNDGVEKFAALFEDLRKAKHTIYVQYYIFKSDGLSTEFMDILKSKAKEGLDVYLLVDGMGVRKMKLRDRKSLEKAGVKFAIFFPGIIDKINTHINYRNHRKIAVIDKRIGYVGGFNVGDEYVSKGPMGYWRDTHLRIEGPAVNGLAWRFFLDFKFASEDHTKGFTTEIFPEIEDGVDINIVTSGPDTKADSIRNGYEKLITSARKELYIQTPYFVPDEGLLKAIKVAALSGVDVHIMFPAKRDHLFVHWASLSFLGELLKWGAHVYQYEAGFLHTKIMISDDYLSSVGTANFDIRSFELNFEVNAFLYDEELNKKLKEDFKRDLEECTEITKETYGKRSKFTKLRESFSRLLSPLL